MIRPDMHQIPERRHPHKLDGSPVTDEHKRLLALGGIALLVVVLVNAVGLGVLHFMGAFGA